jgi:hypothetical protein
MREHKPYQLHNTIPITDATFSEVLARVAYQLIVKDFQREPAAYQTPCTAMFFLSARLEAFGFRALSLWVTAAAYHQTKGKSLKTWKLMTIDRTRQADANRRSGIPWKPVP